MIFLYWNVRGMNNPIKDSGIRSIISRSKAEVVGITETKLLNFPHSKILSLWVNRYVQYEVAHIVNNCSGGLVLIWNPEVFQMRDSIKGMRWIIIIGKLNPGEWECAIGVIFDGLTVEDQTQIYQEINNAKATFSSPLLLFGDSNHIVNVSERRNQ